MMKKEISTSSKNLQQVISFLLGASMASVILFFVLSTNQDGYIEKSSWSSTSTDSTSQKTSSTILQVTYSKTPPPKELKGNETEFSAKESEKIETKFSPRASVKNEVNTNFFFFLNYRAFSILFELFFMTIRVQSFW
jgi:hypothetical protein